MDVAATPLSDAQWRMLEAGTFRFDGFSHGADVVGAYALIRAGYVKSLDVGGGSYTLIQCDISDTGREVLEKAGRQIRGVPGPSRYLVL